MQNLQKRSLSGTTPAAKRSRCTYIEVNNEDLFQQRYQKLLAAPSDVIALFRQHFPRPLTALVPAGLEALLSDVVSDVLLARKLVLMTREYPRKLVVWALFKNLLLLQLGNPSSQRGALTFAEAIPEAEKKAEGSEDEDEDEGSGEEAEENNDKANLVLLRAPAPRSAAKGMALPPDATGAHALCKHCRYKPVLVVDVKTRLSPDSVWQPLACALEYAELSNTDEPVWVLLTDLREWCFYRVQPQRRPATGDTSGAAGSGGLDGAGGSAAGSSSDPKPPRKYRLIRDHGFDVLLLASGITTLDGLVPLLSKLYGIMYPGETFAQVPEKLQQGRDALHQGANKWLASVLRQGEMAATLEKLKAQTAADEEARRSAEARVEAFKATAAAEAEARRLEAEARRLAEAQAEAATPEAVAGAEARRSGAEARRLAEAQAEATKAKVAAVAEALRLAEAQVEALKATAAAEAEARRLEAEALQLAEAQAEAAKAKAAAEAEARRLEAEARRLEEAQAEAAKAKAAAVAETLRLEKARADAAKAKIAALKAELQALRQAGADRCADNAEPEVLDG